MTTRATTLAILAMSACHFVAEGMGDESSSSDTSGDTTFDPSTTTLSGTTSASGTSTSSGTAESSSDSGTFGDDATTTHGESSTGEDVTDWALSFDGTSHGRKIGSDGVVDWTAQDFTVELWLEVQSADVTGVIFDGSNLEFTSGWVLYFHGGFQSLVFSFFDSTHYNNVVVGPATSSLSVGWHHLAATKSGYDVWIHVDGVLVKQQTVPTSVAQHDATIWSLGGNTADLEGFRLQHATLDDIRVTGSPRYDGSDFDPPLVYDETPTILTLVLDEGNDVIVSDETNGMIFSVENPAWVSGNP